MSRRAKAGIRRRTFRYVEEAQPEAQRGPVLRCLSGGQAQNTPAGYASVSAINGVINEKKDIYHAPHYQTKMEREQ